MPTSIFNNKPNGSGKTTTEPDDASIPAAENELHGLASLGHFSAVKELLLAMPDEQRIKEINSFSSTGQTLVLTATRRNNLDALKWLIDNGADPSIADPSGRTAEGWARVKKYEGILNLLSRTIVSHSPGSVIHSPGHE